MTRAANSDQPVVRYLEAYIAPLMPLLLRGDITDLFINRPGEVWIETIGGAIERQENAAIDEALLWRLARQIASLSHQGISREHPLLAATLPDGARVQVVAPPATREHIAIAIRKHLMPDLLLGDYLEHGAFVETHFSSGELLTPELDTPANANSEELADFLSRSVRNRRNIIISGGTSTGKTTFLNALMKEIPAEERIISIEDTAELKLANANSVGLLAVRGELGEAKVTTDDLLHAALRMRPDRIILGELRGSEAYTFLRAVNTGHPGSLTTIHADTPEGAIEQLALIVLQSGTQLRREDIIHYVTTVIDVIVQLERRAGRRRISRIMTLGTS